MTKFYHPKEGEWLWVRKGGMDIACCDCGLVHRFEFRTVGRHVQMRGWRNKMRTAAIRRGMKRRGELV